MRGRNGLSFFLRALFHPFPAVTVKLDNKYRFLKCVVKIKRLIGPFRIPMEASRALRPASVTGVKDLDEYGKAPRTPSRSCSRRATRRAGPHCATHWRAVPHSDTSPAGSLDTDYASRAPAPQAQMLFTKEARGVEVSLKKDLVPRVKKPVFNSPFQVCCT